MSAFVSVQTISQVLSPRAAQIKYLCASDFDEMALICRSTEELLNILSI
jgi:hypothetical protein